MEYFAVSTMQHSPGVCAACGEAATSIGAVDFGELRLTFQELRLYICEGCMAEGAAKLGWARPEETARDQDRISTVEGQLAATTEALAAAQQRIAHLEPLVAQALTGADPVSDDRADVEEETQADLAEAAASEAAQAQAVAEENARAARIIESREQPPAPGQAYSDGFKRAALAQLDTNGGKLKPTADQLGIAPATLRAWRDASEAALPQEQH